MREALQNIDWGKDKLATRSAGQQAMAAFSDFVPTMVGGAADLSESTKTEFPGGHELNYKQGRPARNVFFGVREHGMGGVVNGMAGHGGIVRPYGSTFLQFADYMRGSIRLSALMGLEDAWVYTHDSVGLGEDGPTHQPVEHLAALRAIPHLVVIRPGDANETAAAWRTILEDLEGPAALILSRQDLPVLPDADFDGVARGAYVLRGDDDPEVAFVGTGSELSVAIGAAELLTADGRAHAGGLDAVVGALRRPGRRLPRRGAAARAALRGSRGGRVSGVGALGGPRGGDRPLRGERARAPWSSRSWGSRPRTPRAPRVSSWAR